MMTCSKNLFKHLKNCYQTKTNRECNNVIFIFFANLMIFFSKSKWSNISFPYLFFTFVQNFKPKRKKEKDISWHMYMNVFNHIVTLLKELHEFLCTIDAINIFGKNSLIFSFVSYGIGDKVTWGRVHIWGGGRENKTSKEWMWIFLQPN
jgi:hypothetical protein